MCAEWLFALVSVVWVVGEGVLHNLAVCRIQVGPQFAEALETFAQCADGGLEDLAALDGSSRRSCSRMA